ncbi:ABC transporter permease [Candidatus Sordicultor fermentans]|jgi:ribose transport system permease protein|uniref:ABC transporter permease n=1 Tax=Candidatus Sordicultor fermentans TaxID=1953203 RepID=UPI0016BB028F|nr:ABC transporter permease [Atribacterota bacterium]NLY06562.1 ABC transporter permease [Candidatus Atribacteria bacterium]HOA98998.1 ABC transporter permease [Candidatus Atribacteria bacterium]HOQ50989.1 ABC transporter permease [Candidatus Atribacteria bacterium]HQD33355.1 ABC transporter permease [Candidatus Atribacteria bacterium]
MAEKGGRRAFAERNLLVIIILMAIFLSIATKGNFYSWENISNLLRQSSINGVVAIGMTLIIITGGIDLSVGSIVGLSGMTYAILTSNRGEIQMSSGLAILISLGIAALIGLANGVAVHDGKVPPFIATLGMMTLVRGLVMYVSSGRMITGIPMGFRQFSVATFLNIPALAWIWIILALFMAFVLKYTMFGRNLYAIGSNKEAARLSGINIRLNMYSFYTVAALFSGIAGLMLATRMAAGVPTGGQGYELDAIASVVIGGASLSGGVGTVFGTALGALIIQTMRNGGNLLGVDPFIMQIIIGALIILAVFFDQYLKGRREE